MVQFFIKHKKTRGVITIFLTIVYLAAYIFAGVFVDGARIKMAQTVIEDVQQISTENIMSQYDRGLYEYYGLMATCGYDLDAIAKGVQNEIKAAIGMEFDDDEIKDFLKTITEDAMLLNDTMNSIVDESDGKESKEESEKSKFLDKFFTPYDLNVNVATVSTINLTNIDVLRAQIRDEMRYKFPIILGASFFDALEQFLILGNAADKIKSIVDEISDGNESVIYKQSVYYENINKFYDEYYIFLKKLYGNNETLNDKAYEDDIAENLDSVVTTIKTILANTFGFMINILQFVTGFNISGGIRNLGNTAHRRAICDSIAKIDEGFEEDEFVLNKFANKYNAQPWPQANNYYYISNEEDSDDEDYEPIYELDRDEFKEAINLRASERLVNFENDISDFKKVIDELLNNIKEYKYVKNIDIPSLTDFVGYAKDFTTDMVKLQVNKIKNLFKEINFNSVVRGIIDTLSIPVDIVNSAKKQIEEIVKDSKVVGIIQKEQAIGIEQFFPEIELQLGGINNLIEAHNEYMKEIENKLKFFADKYDEYCNDADNPKIADIYATYLEMFLISWVELKIDGKIYRDIENSIDNIKTNFSDSYKNTENFTNYIIDEDLESIYNYVFDKGDDESRKEELDHLKDLLKEKQHLTVDIIRKHIRDINSSSKEYLDRFNEIDSLQSNLLRLCSAVYNIMTTNKVELFKEDGTGEMHIDPWGHIKPYDKETNPTDSYDSLNDDSFSIMKIPSTVKKILSLPVDIAQRVPKEFTNDMNDVSYILSYFRDYVHTYRATKVSVFDSSGNKDSKYDNFLNAKFIKDQHKTEYLTNSQFKDIEVTPAEIEYILFGDESENSNIVNVIKMYAAIFLIRVAINYVSVFFSPSAIEKVSEISSSFGPFAPIGIILTPLVYALPQSLIDTKRMMYDCEQVTFFNTNFGLFDPYNDIKDALFKEIEDTAAKIGDKAKNVLKQTKEKIKKGFRDYINAEVISIFSHDSILDGKANVISELEMPTILIILNNIDRMSNVPDNVKNARNQLQRWLSKKVIDDGISFLIEDESKKDEITSSNDSESINFDKTFKTGYSSYLTLFLFLFGCTTDGKTEQMTRVQNVIETNMQKAYKKNGIKDEDLFKLKNSYVRVAVESDCSVNYIFMTNSFMPTNIRFKDNDRFKFKIKTASAY